MRRKDRELLGRDELEKILKTARVCRLAFNTGEAPYIVPLNFGYSWGERLTLYFHGAGSGRKWDLLARDPRAGFELDVGHELVAAGAEACEWGMKYGSLVGSGTMRAVDGAIEKRAALDKIMAQYGYSGRPEYADAMFAKTAVLALDVAEIAGKRKA